MLETTRLRIVPLRVEQFRLLLSGTDKMEEALGLSPSNMHLDEHTQQAMEGLFQKLLEHQDEYFWYTSWQIILKSENKSIASACFMEEPNENSVVEIGYGTNASYQRKGYMTEAVLVICEWALDQPKVKVVIAETDRDNYASQKVLQRCGMKLYAETDDSLFWKLEKQ